MDVGLEHAGVGRALVVHHRRSGRRRVRRALRASGFEVIDASDGSEETVDVAPTVDVVLLHVDLPGVDVRELTQRMRGRANDDELPVVLLARAGDEKLSQRAAEAGATDFLFLPADPDMLRERCRALVRLKRARGRSAEQTAPIQTVQGREGELRRALQEVAASREEAVRTEIEGVHRLLAAAEQRDPARRERIGTYAARLAQCAGMPAEDVERLRLAATLRNVGNVVIPDEILLKTTSLDDSEMEVIKGHTTSGARILSGSSSAVLQMGERVARTHHERWDGAGYPSGLRGEDIPLEGRICAIVDYFDALTSDRPYRGPVPTRRVFRMMREESGSRFDPQLLEAFMDNSEAFARLALP